MDVNAISQIESLCSGKNSLDEIIRELSFQWDAKEVVCLIGLLINKKVIVNRDSINSLIHNEVIRKIETLLPNDSITNSLKLPYTILYGRAGHDIWSCGKDESLELASKKLVSEIAEWNAWKFPKEIVRSMFHSYMIPPENIVRYHDDQYKEDIFPFNKFSEHELYTWVKGKNLKDNTEVLLLSDHILFPYNPSHLRYTMTTSSGCAAHNDINKAISHALYELIERDAFMIFWLNKLVSPTINNNSLPEKFRRRINAIEKCRYTVVINDISMGIAPVVIIAVKDLSGRYITSGLASSHSHMSIIESALSEIEVSILHILNSNTHFEKGLEPQNVVSLKEHEELHQQLKYSKETDFIFESSKVISFVDFQNQQKIKTDIVNHLFEHNHDIYVVDASNWDMDVFLPERRNIIRVIVPSLIPLSFGYHREALGMDRIYTIPVERGLRKKKISYEELNRFPHPFN